VLTARAEDRREIIEEAAGILKFRRRKERAERRLENTEASLLRAQDLIREVKRQLRPLERQAEAARRHSTVAAELRALRTFLSGREIAALRARLTTLAGERAQGAAGENEIRRRLAELDTAVLALEAELTARGDSGVSDELVRVEQLRERARGLVALLAERRRSMERDHGRAMAEDVVATLEQDSSRLSSELVEVESALAAAVPEEMRLREEEEVFERERAESETLFGGSAPAASASAAAAAAEVRGETRTLRNSVERSSGDIRRLSDRVAALDERERNLNGGIARTRSEHEELVDSLASAEAAVRAEEDRLTLAERRQDEALAARTAAENESARRAARLDALENAVATLRARTGAEHLAGVDGVVGALVDLIVIDAGYESAVKAALGEALASVVVSDAAAGRRALSALGGAGRVGAILALDRAMSGIAAQGEPAPAGTEDLVRRVVPAPGAPGSVGTLVDSLLARAGFVETLDDAITAAMSSPRAIVVTRAGDRLSSSGWRIGAADDSGSRQAVESAASAAREAESVAAAARAEHDSAGDEVRNVRRALSTLRSQSAAAASGVESHLAALNRAEGDLRALEGERSSAAAELEMARQALAAQQTRVAELEAILPALEEAEAQELAAARAAGEARAAVESKGAHLALRRRDLDIRIGGLRERAQFLRDRLDEVEEKLRANAAARAEAATRRERSERALAAVTALGEMIEGHQRAAESRIAELHAVRQRQSDEVRDLAQRLDNARRGRHEQERSLEEHRERQRRLEVDETELRMRLEAAVETLRRELEIEPEVAEASPLPELAEGVAPADRVRELERDLRLMGPINPLALQEYEELQQRHAFLEAQLEDVRNTRRELMQVIRAVDKEIQSVFAAAFADVSTNFTQLFAMLFPGGKGRLVLTNPDDLLNTGIDVEASPPGKNIKKLSLLSGGERSLTALAYLFAVFRSRPSPFYVLDEVEAALDDVNLHRFLTLVQEFRREAQLLIVSHQKRTMEAGDSLLGVSMQPGGSSKVVTEKSADSTAS